MSATANFRKQHAEILEIAKNIGANLPRLPGAATDVRAQLNSLAAKVNIHLAIEDEALYPRLRAHPDARIQARRTSSPTRWRVSRMRSRNT